MTWQSLVFMVGSIFLASLMVPTLLDKDSSVPRKTSVPTAAVLGIYGATFLTMNGHLLSSVGSFFGMAVWTLVALYRPTK